MKARTGVVFASLGVITLILILSRAPDLSAQTVAAVAQPAAADAKPAAGRAQQAQNQPPAADPATPAPVMQNMGAASQDSSNDLSVTVGKSVVLDLARPIHTIVVGLGDFAEASPISPTQVLVNGKAPGETTLILWDESGARQFFNVTVRASNFASHDQLESVRRQLRMELPGQDLNVTAEGSNIYLRGTVADLTASARAVLIAGTAGKVVNLLNVKVPPPEKQILLKVRFASVDRTKETQLGLNIFSTGFGNVLGAVSTGQFSPPTVGLPGSLGGGGTGAAGTTLSNELNLFAFLPGLNLGATIEAMEQRGLLESLAEPNILAQDGKQASFLAGGEYPFPMVQGAGIGGSGAVTIAFKEYGIRMNFIPTITPRGTIRLQVSPEVSQLDFGNAVSIAGFTEPAITVRRVKTEVELADRQSFAIGGLLDNTENETFKKIPFLGDIPILGKFFQSMQKTKNNTELIVIVTPEIVNPVPEGTEIALPKYTQPFLPPNSSTPMHTPDQRTGEPQPAPATMPVERLLDSMKPEQPLQDNDNGYGTGGYGTGAGMGTTGATSAPGGMVTPQ